MRKDSDFMRAAFCIDDMGGILFGGRRVSADSAVFDDLKTLYTKKLYVTPFSVGLMQRYGIEYVSADNIFDAAEDDDMIFAENISLATHLKDLSEIIVYRWNRRYPSDFKTDIDFSALILTDSRDFKGTSHDKITRNIYKKPKFTK